MGFKVIIVGGSVAGLSTANMLEQFNIDYVLLEAYPQIAPQVGASIGILPNGFRILDQLGCFQPILAIAGECRYTLGSMRGPDGIPLVPASDTSLSVHFEKRVTRLEIKPDAMQAFTEDGSVYEGDLVVGADGIHSAVRDEMWRLGKEQSPGYFPEDEASRVPASTRCIFGISDRPSGYGSRSQQMVLGSGHSYLVIAAPKNRTYWFLFDGLPETKYGKEVSKYSKVDEETLVKARRDDPITEDLTFGDLYDRKIISTLVPLEEYVFDKWHYKRVITIGDSAHKASITGFTRSLLCLANTLNLQIDPASGQGGNGAMESAALLVNALVRQLKVNSQGLSGTQIETALAEVHDLRYERSKQLVAQAHTLQMVVSQRVPFAGLIKRILPCLGPTAFCDVVVPICTAAPKIEGIPVPRRPHFVPFEDELPAKPIKGDLVRRVPWVLASASLGALLYASIGKYDIRAGTAIFNIFHRWGNGGLLATQTGQNSIGGIVARQVPPQFCTPSPSTTQRPVDPRISRSIFPAVVLGYVAPTALALLPIQDTELKRRIGYIWQAYPLLCLAFTRGLAAVRPRQKKRSENQEAEGKAKTKPINFASESEIEMYENKDVSPLKLTHGAAFAACIVALAATKLAPAAGLHTFENWAHSSLSPVLSLTKSTCVINAASGLIYSLYNAWELRSLGFLGTQQAVFGGLASLATLSLVGPGATVAGISYWREHVISSLRSRCG
ncbi:hypothetical protein FAVG1_11917 [Fusarium avenaceum]|nr:hypothetical protein FAVG1_11917 [Fusarium avenaceum]